MKIQSNIAFGARIKMQNVKETVMTLSSLGTAAGVVSATSAGETVPMTTGSSSYSVGTASCVQASGLDSFGATPASLDLVASTAPHRTVEISANNPSAMGIIFSAIGNFFIPHSDEIKDPS